MGRASHDVGVSPAAGGFVHLHLHTEYSLLDGGNRIERLLDRAKVLGMEAVAITDHGNLHGAVEFYVRAKERGIRPILGIEAYVAPGDRRERRTTGVADGGFHLVLLAENETGWRNLLKLSSDSFLNGFYYKPRMDKSTLEAHADGLIAINGHLGSSIAHHLVNFVRTEADEHWREAVREAQWHAQTFAPSASGEPRFYVELQRHGVEEQERINPALIRLARELGLPLVADNDAHFLGADDWEAHDSLCCISMQKTKDDSARIHYSRELWVKPAQAMRELFADLPEAVENTVSIARRCSVDLDFGASHAPMVRIASDLVLPSSAEEARDVVAGFVCEHAAGSTEWYEAFRARFRLEPFDRHRDAGAPEALQLACDGALRLLAEAGAIWRYGSGGIDESTRTRLDRELRILSEKRISAYFLIVWDFVSWAQQRGIPAAARGSGVGTMVGYVLGLSNACPVRYGLLFERFTDPDRSEYPDIDIDICQDGRSAVLDYVRQKYGYVAQIITFGRLKAKQAIKDVARVSGLPPAEGQRLANLVPGELHITLDAALAKEPDFKAEYDQDPRIRAVIDTARALEGHARHAAVHAAGVVVATEPLDNIVPLGRATGSDDVVTQWDGPTCEKVGLLKMDFLGLRTLSTIELAKRIVRETLSEDAVWTGVGRAPHDGGPHPLDLDRLRYDDQRVLALFRRADTSGIFQFESGGMRKLLQEMQPDRIEDLIAANALFRPGPMDLIPEYCARKHRRQPVPTIHPIVDGYTAETYGIMVYQEQVMQIVHSLGGVPLREAYTLIKAISKKKHSVIDGVRSRFVDGAAAQGLNERKAGELFELILKFAGYGFNKSHSTGYAIIAYQTAYLKTYFPAQYMAAMLTYESGARSVDDWAPYIGDCRQALWPDHETARPHAGIEVRPPDLNRSRAEFSVVFDDDEPRDNVHGHVRFGLGAIKGVGKSAVRGIVAVRDEGGPFRSIFDFCERVPSRTVNKAAVEALVKSGAFDSLHGPDARAALFAAVDDALIAGQEAAADRRSGQMSIFAAIDEGKPAVERERRLPAAPAWDRLSMLEGEKQTLGIPVSGHPLDECEAQLRPYCTADLRAAESLDGDTAVVVGGSVSRVRITTVKTGRSAGAKMAMITLQDRISSIEGVVFSDVFARDAAKLREGAIVLLSGRIDRSRGGTQIVVERVTALDEAPVQLARALEITFAGADGEIEHDLRIAAGFLQQAGASRVAGEGRPVEVWVRLETAGRRVAMRAAKSIVPDGALLGRLHDLVGADHVRLVAGPPPVREKENGPKRGAPRARPPRPVAVS